MLPARLVKHACSPRLVQEATGTSRAKMREIYKQHGDLGDVAQVGVGTHARPCVSLLSLSMRRLNIQLASPLLSLSGEIS